MCRYAGIPDKEFCETRRESGQAPIATTGTVPIGTLLPQQRNVTLVQAASEWRFSEPTAALSIIVRMRDSSETDHPPSHSQNALSRSVGATAPEVEAELQRMHSAFVQNIIR